MTSTKRRFIDFAKLREEVPIERIADLLGLQLKKKEGDQWRYQCTVCKGAERALSINVSKKRFYCHASKGEFRGDGIALVSHIQGLSEYDAAAFIEKELGAGAAPSAQRTVPHSAPQPIRDRLAAVLQPLSYLQPEHEAVQALGVSPATAAFLESGHDNGKSVLKGRYLVPVKRNGVLVAYAGIAVNDEQEPRIRFHNFDPDGVIWNVERIEEGAELYIYQDLLPAIVAIENGIPAENVVALLAPLTLPALHAITALIEEKNIDRFAIY